MSINKTYAVFGLGRYGLAVAQELITSGAEVIAVDSDEDTVNAAAAHIPVCKCADITDPEVIEQLGISNVDVAIIAMASNLEASVMATALCKEAGVPTVIAKCADEMHKKILTKIGADRVLIPEQEAGVRLAKNLLSSGFTDIIDLSKDISMVEIAVRPEWVGRSLIELNLRNKYSLNIVAIKQGEITTIDIDPSKPLQEDATLVVVGNTKKLKKI
ncbi:MAG: TrkA family potassium uptake protein [Ruminococcus sp.]|nr:TrkA family potassium uptake protein [Ruminococcus sp.]